METTLLGTEIGLHEIMARWAYSELVSERFKESFKKDESDPLFLKAANKIPFEYLNTEEKSELVDRIETHPDRSGLLPALTPYQSFICQAWTRDQLLQTICVPGLGWRPLRELVGMQGFFPPNHPRSVVDKITGAPCFVQSDPIIVVPYKHQGREIKLLLEGTLRSCLFLKANEPDGRIMVWVPSG